MESKARRKRFLGGITALLAGLMILTVLAQPSEAQRWQWRRWGGPGWRRTYVYPGYGWTIYTYGPGWGYSGYTVYRPGIVGFGPRYYGPYYGTTGFYAGAPAYAPYAAPGVGVMAPGVSVYVP
jgi:hypothetical protein